MALFKTLCAFALLFFALVDSNLAVPTGCQMITSPTITIPMGSMNVTFPIDGCFGLNDRPCDQGKAATNACTTLGYSTVKKF